MAKVLVVDDAQIMRNILRVMLEKAGHDIIGNAANGEQALKLYGELQPDLVTMDIQMTGGNGITFLKEILKMDPAARVIMVSALGPKKEEEVRKLGAVGYVAKPFQIEDLLQQVRSALAN